MYNERTNFSLKNVIIQFLFLALLIFILIWLFPLKSDLNNLNNGSDSNLSVLVDRIFNENIIAMKDAAKSYYTTPRLPQNVGDKVKMTLGEMLDKKIILPFTDKNGNACSLTDSYVEITKYDEEFVMKVNLKCDEEENYLLVYMGCYDYCSTAICEKNQSDVKSPVIYSSKEQVKEETKTPVINNVVNNVINNIINTVTPDPKPEEKYYCTIANGKYYDANGNIVDESAYKASCEQIVVPEDPEYLYEYKKTTNAVCTESDWSDWSTTPVSASSNVSVKTKTVTSNQLIGYNVTTATDYSKPIYGTKEIVTGTETKNVCTAYEYVPTGEYSYSEYKYVGDEYFTYTPQDTNTVKYIWADDSNWVCGENCTSGTPHKYQKWERTATPITKYQCTKWEKKTVELKTKIQVITGYETKVVSKEPVYKKVTTKYYSTKTRTCTSATSDIKWSSYNDTTLLNNGYIYTGNKKQK